MLSVYTVVSRSHLHRARVLMADVARNLPEARRLVYLVDESAGLFDPAAENFEVIPPAACAPVEYRHLAFGLSPVGLCCVHKAYALLHLRRAWPDSAVIYLDADTRLYTRPVALLAALERHAIVLTPHFCEARHNARLAMEHVLGGIYNGGVFALAPGPTGTDFAAWWAGQIGDPNRAIEEFAFDQAWFNYVPALFPNVGVLRDAGYNVAYWNLHERALTRADAATVWEVNHSPLVVFHFSGFRLETPGVIAGELARVYPLPDPRWRELGADYARLLTASGAESCSRWGYEFSAFRDGKVITPEHRDFFAKRLWPVLPRNLDPFDPGRPEIKAGLTSLYFADHPVVQGLRQLRRKLGRRPVGGGLSFSTPR